MARKQVLPADQLERLKKRYERERDALVNLTKTRIAVEEAARHLDAARDRLEEARRLEAETYQQVVALVGAAAAAELSGGPTNGQASRPRRPSRPRGQRAADQAAAGDAAEEQPPQSDTRPGEGSGR